MTPKIHISTLESHLWEAANILPPLFFKRICDVWDEEYAAYCAALRNTPMPKAAIHAPFPRIFERLQRRT